LRISFSFGVGYKCDENGHNGRVKTVGLSKLVVIVGLDTDGHGEVDFDEKAGKLSRRSTLPIQCPLYAAMGGSATSTNAESRCIGVPVLRKNKKN